MRFSIFVVIFAIAFSVVYSNNISRCAFGMRNGLKSVNVSFIDSSQAFLHHQNECGPSNQCIFSGILLDDKEQISLFISFIFTFVFGFSIGAVLFCFPMLICYLILFRIFVWIITSIISYL
jgi:hypothetical protein